MITKSVNNKFILKSLERTKFGSIKLTFGNPYSDHIFGEGEQVADVWMASPSILSDIVKGGDIELASAIIRGDIKISDEAAFIEWACKNDDVLKDSFHGKVIFTLLPRIKRLLRMNTVSGAKKNIMAHYDLGNDFYKTWLDSSMTYSSAIFSKERTEDLTLAQLVKYDRIIDQLGITSQDHILEVGCGWGGFFSRAVERTGCKVTAVMNSPAQAAHNRELIQRRQLDKNVDLRLMDYRDISGKFDKIVSIEMIEAVGQQFWPVYFNKISSSLNQGGKALIQSITIRENRFDDYSKNPDFINTMIFPGGMLLTNQIISSEAKKAGMESIEKPFEFGLSYAETLQRWRDNFLKAIDSNLLPHLDDRFVNLWRFYLSYCEGAFNAERINVGHFLVEKTANS
ncbi:MAG: class I SAM-dependent methyltransferase [Bacteriovoracaceae bacterium]